MRNIWVLGFGASYIREFTVFLIYSATRYVWITLCTNYNIAVCRVTLKNRGYWKTIIAVNVVRLESLNYLCHTADYSDIGERTLFWAEFNCMSIIEHPNITFLADTGPVLPYYRLIKMFYSCDVIKWKKWKKKKNPRYWPFVWGIHRSPVNSHYKGQWRGVLMFCLICTWTNGWVNNRYAGDLRCPGAYYDVTVMSSDFLCSPTGMLMLGPESSEEMRDTKKTLDVSGAPYETLTHSQIAAKYPQLTVPPNFSGIYDEDAGVLRSEKCVYGMQVCGEKFIVHALRRIQLARSYTIGNRDTRGCHLGFFFLQVGWTVPLSGFANSSRQLAISNR